MQKAWGMGQVVTSFKVVGILPVIFLQCAIITSKNCIKQCLQQRSWYSVQMRQQFNILFRWCLRGRFWTERRQKIEKVLEKFHWLKWQKCVFCAFVRHLWNKRKELWCRKRIAKWKSLVAAALKSRKCRWKPGGDGRRATDLSFRAFVGRKGWHNNLLGEGAWWGEPAILSKNYISEK